MDSSLQEKECGQVCGKQPRSSSPLRQSQKPKDHRSFNNRSVTETNRHNVVSSYSIVGRKHQNTTVHHWNRNFLSMSYRKGFHWIEKKTTRGDANEEWSLVDEQSICLTVKNHRCRLVGKYQHETSDDEDAILPSDVFLER
jgi:hypothetical protein